MKRTSIIIATIILIIALYLTVSFILWELNPAEWQKAWRGVASISFAIVISKAIGELRKLS